MSTSGEDFPTNEFQGVGFRATTQGFLATRVIDVEMTENLLATQEPLNLALGSQEVAIGEPLILELSPPRPTEEMRVQEEEEEPKSFVVTSQRLEDPKADRQGEMLLAQHPAGLVTWHFPTLPDLRGGNTYQGPVIEPTPDLAGTIEDLARGRGRRVVFKLLRFPAEHIVGWAADRIAQHFESHQFARLLRTVTPHNFALEHGGLMSDADWSRCATGRTLLILHGTHMRSDLELRRLIGAGDPALIDDLNRAYDNRVIAFDYPTLSAGPADNALWFFQNLPQGIQLDLDILAISQGGLLAREICERPGAFRPGNRNVRVHTLVHVAVPNGGTPLASPAWIDQLLTATTNILQLGASEPIIAALVSVVAAAKTCAVGAMDGLTGIAAMAPTSTTISFLNEDDPEMPGTVYRAVAGDFTGASSGALRALSTWFERTRIFDGQPNDLVVPTLGVSAPTPENTLVFPIADPCVRSLDHSGYLVSAEVRAMLRQWLKP